MQCLLVPVPLLCIACIARQYAARIQAWIQPLAPTHGSMSAFLLGMPDWTHLLLQVLMHAQGA